MAEDSSSAEVKYRITDGCPTCGGEHATDGHDDIQAVEDNPPVCTGCGEVLSSSVVEEL